MSTLRGLLFHEEPNVMLYHGDSLVILPELAENSVDACVTDPPYGLEFMGKEWDKLGGWQAGGGFSKPGIGERETPWVSFSATSRFGAANPTCAECGGRLRGAKKCSCPQPHDHWKLIGKRRNPENDGLPDDMTSTGMRGHLSAMQAWHEQWARAVFRVLKPGGYLVAAGGTRTFHRMVCALEDAGFEVRDTICWIYSQGFPKSLNVSRALRALPSCSCDVPNEIGAVASARPSSTVGTGVGTETGAVPLAGLPADDASWIRANVGTDAGSSFADVDDGIESADGHTAPVVLGSSTVARPTESDEVVGGVGGAEVLPESLWDDVVREEAAGLSTINTSPVAGDNRCSDHGPATTPVVPSASAPSRIVYAGEPPTVGDGHTPSRAVRPRGDVARKSFTAFGADEGSRHVVKCNACGGVRGNVAVGLGTALKPAVEFFTLARKPLSESNVAANVLRWGTGALNIDGCRVRTDEHLRGGAGGLWSHYRDGKEPSAARRYTDNGGTDFAAMPGPRGGSPDGRWPANLLLDEQSAAMLDAQSGELTSGKPAGIKTGGQGNAFGCIGDSGGASRFFYTAKADRADRDGSKHPTVKPTDLMGYLVRLVTPPGGVVLDHFMGSGPTIWVAREYGFQAIGIDRELEYVKDAVKRLRQEVLPL